MPDILPEAPAEIVCVKGFNLDWTCRGYQYALGQTYEHEGAVKPCESGFHACEYPLDMLGYYPPATSRYALVTLDGETARHQGDTKVAGARITIDAEIHLPELIERAVKWVFDRAKPEKGSQATGVSGAAMASGHGGRVMGKAGNALFLTERAEDGEITHVWAGIVGRDGIEEDVWYTLKGGKPVKEED